MEPAIPPIPGLPDIPYLTSDLLDAGEAGRLAELPESLVVFGGGYVAVELAQMFSRIGSRVTLATRSELLRDYEPELGQTLARVFSDEGIRSRDRRRRTTSGGFAVNPASSLRSR